MQKLNINLNIKNIIYIYMILLQNIVTFFITGVTSLVENYLQR